MSKDPGPGASSFESPSKVGWLYKHGGSGVSSHWRKRWFVADHHYLFYYKGPNDKKPVGIVCLPDYESCHKAEIKVWKKQHSFMLDRGNSSQDQDSSDGAPVKNYVLCADSEEDMEEWIKTLSEEIKQRIGENRYANGFSGGKTGGGGTSSGSSSSSGGSSKGGGGKGKKGKGGEPGVDDKALDQVTALAGEGPKLTHLTASRPKVPKGRRPPKRYAVFHEDDSRPEESPPDTPDLSKPSEPSPSSSPSESPATQRKKGHKPTVALLPNMNRAASVRTPPKIPPIPPAKVAKADSEVNIMAESESPGPQKIKFSRPPPPKKPSKEKPTTVKEELPPAEGPSPEPSEPPRTQRPIPPTKPSKDKEATPSSEKVESIQNVQPQQSVEDETKGPHRPSPIKKPRPQPPVKPRTSTAASTGSAASGDGTTAAAQVAESAPQPQKPVPARKPVPRKRTTTPQDSPSREAVQLGQAAANKEPAVAKEEAKPSPVKEPATPVKEVKPAAKETVVSVKETKPEPEKEIKPAAKEEPVVPEKEVKPPAKEPAILEKEDESAIKEAAIPEKEAKPTPAVSVKEEKPTEGKTEKAAVETIDEKPKEKEEKLPPTPFDDVEEILEKVTEPEKVEEQLLPVEGDNKQPENLEDDSKYVYEDMQNGEKSEPKEQKKVKADNEYEIMSFNAAEAEKEKREKEQPLVAAPATEAPREQRQAPGKVHQYDEVAMDEFEPRFKISSSSIDVALCISGGYEHMEPAPAVRIADKEKEVSLDGEYVPMKDGVIIDQEQERERENTVTSRASTDKYEYEEPSEWVARAPPIIKDVSPPYDALSATPVTPSHGDYDVPRSSGNSPSHRPDILTPEGDIRQSVVSSTGSVSSQKSDNQLQPITSSLEVKDGRSGSRGGGCVVSDSEERRRGSSSASKKSGGIGEGAGSIQLERDPLGYAKVNKNRQGAKDERINSVTSEFDRGSSPAPPEIIPMVVPIEESPKHSTHKTVPETLRQAKEVLRLARVVKAEAEQMREEARKELSIAKKDRHDAMILKKNAAEILRMAKERLSSLGAK